jgi:hypothetical protein
LLAAGATVFLTQRSTWGIMGQRRSAAGFSATRPSKAAAISKGLAVPQTLGPPSADLVWRKDVWRTTPEAMHALSSSSRQGSYLATKSGPELQAGSSTVAKTQNAS